MRRARSAKACRSPRSPFVFLGARWARSSADAESFSAASEEVGRSAPEEIANKTRIGRKHEGVRQSPFVFLGALGARSSADAGWQSALPDERES